MSDQDTAERPAYDGAFKDVFERPDLIQLLIEPDDGTIYDANSAACEFYGFSLGQFRQLKVKDINLMSEAEVQTEMQNAKAEKRPFFRFRHRLADHQVRHVSVNSGLVHVGVHTLLHSVIYDATGRIEAERQREQLTLAMRSTADAVVVTDARGYIQTINEAFTHITGFSSEDVVGQRTSVLKSGVQDPTFYRELWSTVRRGQTWRGTLINRKKDGSTYDASLTISPLSDGKGYVAVQRDITELVQAQHRADAAAQARAIFLATMSHEIRTPLNGIIGLAHLLGATPLNVEQSEYANTIRSAGDSLLAIVNDVLDFSKIGAGEFELDRSQFQLDEMVSTVVEVLKPAARDK